MLIHLCFRLEPVSIFSANYQWRRASFVHLSPSASLFAQRTYGPGSFMHCNKKKLRQYSINKNYKWYLLLKIVSGIIKILRTYLTMIINKKNIIKWMLEGKKQSTFLLPWIVIFFNLTIRSSRFKDPKIKIKKKSHGLNISSSSILI
jgi:hypothetical protein